MVSVVPPAVAIHPSPQPEMSEDPVKFLNLRKGITAMTMSVGAAASSTEGLVKAEEVLDELAKAEIVNRGPRPLLASGSPEELIRPKSQEEGSREMEEDEPVNFAAQLLNTFALPVSPGPGSPSLSEYTLNGFNGTLQSLRSVEGEEQGTDVHTEQEVKVETGTVVSTPFAL